MTDRQELIKRIDDMCQTKLGELWPHDLMQCLNDCRAALSDQWISVDEKPIELPCLIYWSDGGVESYLADFCIDDLTACCDAIDGYHATHWMPLPEPPED